MDSFTLQSTDGKTPLYCVKWVPSGPALGVVQLVHGMVEYIERYDDFASYLCAQGFYVIGCDHIAHGNSVLSKDDWGHFSDDDGFETLIDDIGVVRAYAQREQPSIPYFLFGHSMGSYAVRNSIMRHPEGLAGAIICGTGNQSPALLRAGQALCSVLKKVHSPRYKSTLVHNMALGALDKPYKSEGLKNAFLTTDTAVVDAYNAEPRCSFMFTVGSYHSMFGGMIKLHDKESLLKIPKSLPLFVASGACDPLGNMGKDIRALYESYLALGIKDVTLKLFDGMRHEVLNEKNKAEAYAAFSQWLHAHVTAAAKAV